RPSFYSTRRRHTRFKCDWSSDVCSSDLIIISGWLGSAPANMATSYELNVIAAAVIGGANLAGGIGGPLGAIVGCVLLEVIRNGLVLAQVNSYWQQTLVGVIIILAVLVDRIRSRII